MTDEISNRFAAFQSVFTPDYFSKGPARSWSERETLRLIGHSCPAFTEFISTYARTSYNEGLIRFLLPEETPSLLSWNDLRGWPRDWPKWRERLVVFSYDWQGRQIAFDRGRADASSAEPMIAILEPGTGEVLEVPENFEGFMERELIEYRDDALGASFYSEWRAGGGGLPLTSQCVGYNIPLFLGGRDEISNLKLGDLEVYVSLCGQLYNQTT